MKFRVSLMLVPLLLVSGALAQGQAPHVCGAGPGPNEVQAGVQPAGPGMAPTPLCYWKNQQRPQQPPQPSGWWETTWGAIAPSPVGGVLGVALGASSKEEAERLALEDCSVKGGGACEIALSYHNQCAALIVGEKTYSTAHAPSESEAKSIGIAICEKNNKECGVYYSACTEPVFHRY